MQGAQLSAELVLGLWALIEMIWCHGWGCGH